MLPHLIVIPLPSSMRTRLASFCFGLPHVRWVEEDNFHIVLRHFFPLSDLLLAEIKERLRHLFFHSFSLSLQGVDHHHFKRNKGVIWINIANDAEIISLKKEIDKLLRGLILPGDEHPFHPRVILGYYERANPQKLGEYLSGLAHFQSGPIEINNCLLVEVQHTPKHIILQTIEQYSASHPATGED